MPIFEAESSRAGKTFFDSVNMISMPFRQQVPALMTLSQAVAAVLLPGRNEKSDSRQVNTGAPVPLSEEGKAMKRITSQREFFFSQTLGKPIYDRNNKLVGRLRDVAVRWDNHYPRVTGIKFAKHVQKHIGIGQIEQWDERSIRLNVAFTDDLQGLANEELYVGKWLLDKQIIDTKGSKLVRVNDIMLAWIESGHVHDLILVAVDVGVRGLLRRIGVETLVRGRSQNLVDWKYIKPPESKMGNLRLTLEHP
jgi:sporulation protein YlmC with PRC-barrel domain